MVLLQCYNYINCEGVNVGASVSSLAALGVARCVLDGVSTHRGADGRAPFLAGREQGAVQVSARTAVTSVP
jgi:hypothetical protein